MKRGRAAGSIVDAIIALLQATILIFVLIGLRFTTAGAPFYVVVRVEAVLVSITHL